MRAWITRSVSNSVSGGTQLTTVAPWAVSVCLIPHVELSEQSRGNVAPAQQVGYDYMSGKKKRRWEYQISCAGFVGRTPTEQVWIPAGVSECNFMTHVSCRRMVSLQLVTAARVQVASRQPGSTVSLSFCGIHPCLMQILRARLREQLKENENNV